jgi:hypothetical protein
MRLVALELGGSREPWARIGLPFTTSPLDERAECDVVSCVLRLDPVAEPGVHGWALSDVSVDSIDGIPTRTESTDHQRAFESSDAFVLDVVGVDHVVVMTPDLMRTSEAFAAATGAPLKRVREGGAESHQAFHRLGNVVIEIVSTPHVPQGPARLWGFVLTVNGLHDVATYLGPDVLSPPKSAVQEGRLIATFRQAAALGVPVALMTPE